MLLEMNDIYKAYTSTPVLRGVTLRVGEGEIRALIGENGAGKTTLMNILGGVTGADKGEIYFAGTRRSFARPRDSLDAGIAFIHQELNLVNDLNVYENLFLGRELHRHGMLDTREMARQAGEVLRSVGVGLSPSTLVGELDASYKQTVEICRALMMNARLIIMDEPTTSLTEPEIERVFSLMRTLKARGVSIIFISHKLREVLEICDTYTVLRDGVVAGDGATASVDSRALARMMVGHDVSEGHADYARPKGDVLLEARSLTRTGEFYDISFALRRGEVLGFTGLLGDGRSELFQCVCGLTRPQSGQLLVDGRPVTVRSTEHALKLGMGYVPRNRKENGIVPDMSILENSTLVTLKRLRRGPFIDHRREQAQVFNYIHELRIKLNSPDDLITSLSGGNQQKVVLSKWLGADPRILIFDNPTQGVDVGAKEEIYGIIDRLARAGVAIVVLSSETQEIRRLCDRTLVMYHGRIAGELYGPDITEQAVMLLATGSEMRDSAG